MVNFRYLILSLLSFLLVFTITGCEGDDKIEDAVKCTAPTDCKASQDCKFESLVVTSGVCVKRKVCDANDDCSDGLDCSDDKYCGSKDVFEIKEAALEDAMKDADYSFKLEVTSNSAAYYFELLDGSVLPDGLALSDDGTISGKVTANLGTYTFTVRAVNGPKNSEFYYNHRKVTAELTIKVVGNTVSCKEDSCKEANKGVCDDSTGEIVCSCDAGYQDSNSDATCNATCETAALNCGNGVCAVGEETGKAECSCNENWVSNNEGNCTFCDPELFHVNPDDSSLCESNTRTITCTNTPGSDAAWHSNFDDGDFVQTWTDGEFLPNIAPDKCLWECNGDNKIHNLEEAACVCDVNYQDNNTNGECTPSCSNDTSCKDANKNICDDASGVVVCSCNDGYQDNNNNSECAASCDTAALDCGNGSCADTTGAAICVCDGNWSGDDCKTCDPSLYHINPNNPSLCESNTRTVICTNIPASDATWHGDFDNGDFEQTWGSVEFYPNTAPDKCLWICNDTDKVHDVDNSVCICKPELVDDTNGGCMLPCTDNQVNNGDGTCSCYPAYTGDDCLSCNTGFYASDDGRCKVICDSTNERPNEANDACICDEGLFRDSSSNCVTPCNTLVCEGVGNSTCKATSATEYVCECNAADGYIDDGNGQCICDDAANRMPMDGVCVCKDTFITDLDGLCVPQNSCSMDVFSSATPTNNERINAGELSFVNGLAHYEDLTTQNTSCEQADDWYKLTLSEGQKIKVDLGFINKDGDLDLYLFLGENTSYTTRSATTLNSESMTYTVLDSDIPDGETSVDAYIQVKYGRNIYFMDVYVVDAVNPVCYASCDESKEVCVADTNGMGVCTCDASRGFFDNGFACVNPCAMVTCDAAANLVCEAKNAIDAICVCEDNYIDVDTSNGLNCLPDLGVDRHDDANIYTIDNSMILAGNNARFNNDYTGRGCTGDNQRSKDVVYKVMLNPEDKIQISLEDINLSYEYISVYLMSQEQAENSTLCSVGKEARDATATDEYIVEVPGTYYVVVDGNFLTTEFDYKLNVTIERSVVEPICTEATESVNCIETGLNRCLVDATNSVNNKCVECLEESDCITGTTCNVDTNICETALQPVCTALSESVDCIQTGQNRCLVDDAEPMNNKCVECLEIGDCVTGTTCNVDTNICETAIQPACTVATESSDCLETGLNRCLVDDAEPMNNKCVGCLDSGECVSGDICNIETHVCEQEVVTVLPADGGFELIDNGNFRHWNGSKSSIANSAITALTAEVHGGLSAVNLVSDTTSHKRFTSVAARWEAGDYTCKYFVKGHGDIRNNYFDGTNYATYSDYTVVDSMDWIEVTYTFTLAAASDTFEFIFSLRNTNSDKNHLSIDDITCTK